MSAASWERLKESPAINLKSPAALARRLGSHLLTEAVENRPEIGLESYDRLFPNQDTMPQGGFGNLIALPLQRGPRSPARRVPTLSANHTVSLVRLRGFKAPSSRSSAVSSTWP